MATALSRKRRTRPWTEKMLWEDEDSIDVTAQDVAAGSLFTQLIHSKIVEHHEFEVFINGVKLGPTEFTLEPFRGEVNITVPDWCDGGEKIRFHYAYYDFPNDRTVAATYVSSSDASTQTGALTTCPMPAGTKKGDLVLLVAKANDIVLNDPRLVEIHRAPYDQGHGVFAYAEIKDDLSAFQVTSSTGGGWWRFVSATTLRAVEGELHVDKTLKSVVGQTNSTTAPLPALNIQPGRMSGAVCMYLTSAGVGGVYGAQNWSKSAPQWSFISARDYSYVEVDMAMTDDLPVVGVPTPNTDPEAGWMAVAVGLTTDG